jgi:hypothetical protein
MWRQRRVIFRPEISSIQNRRDRRRCRRVSRHWQNGFGLDVHRFVIKKLSLFAAANNGANTP